MKRTGAQIVWDALEGESVRYVFGYPGGAILPVYDALLDSRIHHVLVRHEQGAAHMADGYARASGEVGVAMATEADRPRGLSRLAIGLGVMLLALIQISGAAAALKDSWVFRAVLSYSRKAYSEVVWRQTSESFLRCLENAFRYFGGVTATVVPDNLKAGVLQPTGTIRNLIPSWRSLPGIMARSFCQPSR